MSNTSYCRYENTYHDLRDCFEAMADEISSESERKYRLNIIKLTQDIVNDFGGEVA